MRLSKFLYRYQIRNTSVHRQALQHWQDILLTVAIAIVAGFASYQGAQLIDPALMFDKQTTDVWFHSDTIRVFNDMAIFESSHPQAAVHPLFALIALPLVSLVKTVLLLEPITAVQIVIATVASFWFSLLFILLRVIGCRRFDATLFSILAATSAAAMFYFVIPETFPFGSLSILLALGLVALGQHRKLSPTWYLAVNTLTLGFTVTNWMAGIFATIINHRRKQSLLIALKALGLVAILVVVQDVIFPHFNAGFLLPFRSITGEISEISKPESGSETSVPLQVVKSFFFDTVVMPGMQLVENIKPRPCLRMTIQASPLGSGSLWGIIAVVLWAALLGLGLWGLFSIRKHLQLRVVLGLTLLGQLILHLVYGTETFLYALHFLPLLVVLAALGTLTRARPLALLLAGLLVLSAGVNNGLQLSKATAFPQGHGPLCTPTSTVVK